MDLYYSKGLMGVGREFRTLRCSARCLQTPEAWVGKHVQWHLFFYHHAVLKA